MAIEALSPAVPRKGGRAAVFGLECSDGDVELSPSLRTCRRVRSRFHALDFLRGLDRLPVKADLQREGGRLSCFRRLVRFDGPEKDLR